MAQKKLLLALILVVLLPSITYGVEDRFEFRQEDLDWANSLAKISQNQSLLAIKKKWQQLWIWRKLSCKRLPWRTLSWRR